MSFYDLRETFDSLLSFFKNSVFPYAVIFILLGVILGMWYYIVLKKNNPYLDLSISPFNRSIITIAVIFLVILILGMWYIFSKGKSNIKFPPMLSNCPDYWELGNLKEKYQIRENRCPTSNPYPYDGNGSDKGYCCDRKPISTGYYGSKLDNCNGGKYVKCENPPCGSGNEEKKYKTVEYKNVCINKQKLGYGCKKFNPRNPKYHGPQGKIEKCKWAKNCGIVWDGITNNDKC